MIRCLSTLPAVLPLLLASLATAQTTRPTTQWTIAAVERMPSLPEPLDVRDWGDVSRSYYQRVLDPQASGDGFPAVAVDDNTAGFRMKSYLGHGLRDEAFTCVSAVIGAKLVGLPVRDLHGVDYVARCKAWYDPRLGIYRHRPGDRSGFISDDIYGYWAAVQGMMLASLFPQDSDLNLQATTAADAFERIATGLGCPDHPDFSGLGFDLSTGRPGGRNEPMNRLGSAPCVAWALLAGAKLQPNKANSFLREARSIMNWYADHPGRYEISHVMGPLTAARLNSLDGTKTDMDRILASWFGDGDPKRHPWFITSGTRRNGITCDGLDGARWRDGGFNAFTMGSLQGPAWLLPVARYDPRYARAIGRYALHAANSARLLQGHGLDPHHQDHAAWKPRNDPGDLLFYESLASWDWDPRRTNQPYATGDPVRLGWGTGHPRIPPDQYLAQRSAWFGDTCFNIALYMGNHVGFLGGIVQPTNVPGILKWDCLATDWFHPPALPTFLLFNPHPQSREVTVSAGNTPVNIYDAVSHRFIARNAAGQVPIQIDPDTPVLMVFIPANAALDRQNGRLLADGIVIDFLAR